jgi:hypothetical protein
MAKERRRRGRACGELQRQDDGSFASELHKLGEGEQEVPATTHVSTSRQRKLHKEERGEEGEAGEGVGVEDAQ